MIYGFDSVTHSELVHNLLRCLLKIDLPGIVTFSVGDLHHAAILKVCHIMKKILQEKQSKQINNGLCLLGPRLAEEILKAPKFIIKNKQRMYFGERVTDLMKAGVLDMIGGHSLLAFDFHADVHANGS